MGDRRVFNHYLFEDIVFERHSGFAWWPHDCVNKRSTVVRAYSWVVTQPEYTAGVNKFSLRPEDNASSSYHPSARLTHFFLKMNITIPTSVEKRLWMFWWDTAWVSKICTTTIVSVFLPIFPTILFNWWYTASDKLLLESSTSPSHLGILNRPGTISLRHQYPTFHLPHILAPPAIRENMENRW